MTIIEALKISNIVRRRAWGNPRLCMKFYDTYFNAIKFTDHLSIDLVSQQNVFGKEALLADDWQALTEVETSSIMVIENISYTVKE